MTAIEDSPFYRYRDRLAAGTVTFDDAADMFLDSVAGRELGWTRAEFLANCHAKFPTQAALNDSMREAAAAFYSMLATLKGMQS